MFSEIFLSDFKLSAHLTAYLRLFSLAKTMMEGGNLSTTLAQQQSVSK